MPDFKYVALDRAGKQVTGTLVGRDVTGDPPHRYVFHVYELRRKPSLRPGFTDAQLRTAIRGNLVASGTVVGRYGR